MNAPTPDTNEQSVIVERGEAPDKIDVKNAVLDVVEPLAMATRREDEEED